MSRTFIWVFAGLMLGLVIHLVVILLLPRYASTSVWEIFAKIAPAGEIITLERPAPGKSNMLRLDPELAYAVCRYDLSRGPGVLVGNLPQDFWSIGVFDKSGVAIYSTTNRSGSGGSVELGIFNPAQTFLLVEQKLNLQEGLIVVEAPRNEVFVVVRLAPPYPAMWERYREILTRLQCGHIDDSQGL